MAEKMVLVVDDDQQVIRMIICLLEGLVQAPGRDVFCIEVGSQRELDKLGICGELRFDLVISGVGSSRGGWAKALAEAPHCPDIPTIIMSGREEEDVFEGPRRVLTQAGYKVIGVVKKPFPDALQFAAMMRDILFPPAAA